eukprot:m.173919 g.173919  ORF g.173919 m.173919 type:complete len:290 (-) comp53284_c0_seq3:194-1063(-)
MQSLEVDYSLFLRFRQCLCKRVLEIDESYAPGSSVLSTPPSPPPPPPPATAATTASALAAALSASLARQHASISPVPSAQMADLPFVPYPSLAAPMFPSRGRGRGGFRGGMRGGIRSVPAHSQDIDSLDAMMDDFYSPDEVSMPPGPVSFLADYCLEGVLLTIDAGSSSRCMNRCGCITTNCECSRTSFVCSKTTRACSRSACSKKACASNRTTCRCWLSDCNNSITCFQTSIPDHHPLRRELISRSFTYLCFRRKTLSPWSTRMEVKLSSFLPLTCPRLPLYPVEQSP